MDEVWLAHCWSTGDTSRWGTHLHDLDVTAGAGLVTECLHITIPVINHYSQNRTNNNPLSRKKPLYGMSKSPPRKRRRMSKRASGNWALLEDTEKIGFCGYSSVSTEGKQLWLLEVPAEVTVAISN